MRSPAPMSGEYINERDAAAFLGLSVRTLQKARVTGDGPPYHKFFRRVKYNVTELEAWAHSQRRHSTSDAAN